jgi:hypothetical protein
MMNALADLLARTNLVDLVNAVDWLWPLFEILHFVGMSLLIGTVGLVDLRILGVGKGLPITVLERFIPLGVAGFAINLLTGFVFIAGNPVGGPLEYLENLSFQLKMLLVLIAGVNLLAFYATGVARATAGVAAEAEAPPGAKVVAAVSLAVWFGVIIFGRLIMYNDTLLYALGL